MTFLVVSHLCSCDVCTGPMIRYLSPGLSFILDWHRIWAENSLCLPCTSVSDPDNTQKISYFKWWRYFTDLYTVMLCCVSIFTKVIFPYINLIAFWYQKTINYFSSGIWSRQAEKNLKRTCTQKMKIQSLSTKKNALKPSVRKNCFDFQIQRNLQRLWMAWDRKPDFWRFLPLLGHVHTIVTTVF